MSSPDPIEPSLPPALDAPPPLPEDAPSDAATATDAAKPAAAELPPEATLPPVAAEPEPLPAEQSEPLEGPPAQELPAAGARIELKDRIPNASVGKHYDVRLPDIWGDGARHVIIGAVTVPPETGLTFDAADARLHGAPAVAGEYDLKVMLRPAAHPDRPEVERKFRLTINPDPRSLWKNLPSDPALPFAKPDDASAALDAEELRWLGASRRGRSHAHEAKPRDDDFSFTRLSNGWHVAIASDGAGGSKYSRRGSQLACETTMCSLSARLGDGLDSSVQAWFSSAAEDSLGRLKSDLYTLLGGAAFETHKVLAAEAEKHSAAARDFHATYIVVIAKQFDEEWFAASFTIGDGGAGLLDETGGLHILSTPDGGDFAGQTVFVTMPSVFKDPAALMRRVHCHRVASLKMIVLMTDGVTDPKFETDTNFETPSYWHALSSEVLAAIDGATDSPAAAAALLTWLDFWSPGNHDDRTIVLGLPLVKPQRYLIT